MNSFQNNLKEISLFSGGGGGLLASMLLGFKTICAVEINEYSRAIIRARQKDGYLDDFPIFVDIKEFNGEVYKGACDIVTGGFPCQPYSKASRGHKVAECLLGEMMRVVSDVRPAFVFAENVSILAIEKACDGFESMGYKTKAIALSASDMGADHTRRRYWMLAYSDHKGELLRNVNAKMAECEEFQTRVWDSFPGESGMVDGVAHRMDRFKAIGNGQVPIVAAKAFMLLLNNFNSCQSIQN